MVYKREDTLSLFLSETRYGHFFSSGLLRHSASIFQKNFEARFVCNLWAQSCVLYFKRFRYIIQSTCPSDWSKYYYYVTYLYNDICVCETVNCVFHGWEKIHLYIGRVTETERIKRWFYFLSLSNPNNLLCTIIVKLITTFSVLFLKAATYFRCFIYFDIVLYLKNGKNVTIEKLVSVCCSNRVFYTSKLINVSSLLIDHRDTLLRCISIHK